MTRQREEKRFYKRLVAIFVQACGLRKHELERLRVRDFYRKKRAFISHLQWIHVDAQEGIPAHEVPFDSKSEWIIAEICQDRAPDDLVFPVLPELDYEHLRRCYASKLFLGYYGSIGSLEGPRSIREVGQQVKKALGLPRLDDALQNKLRWARADWKKQSAGAV